LLRLNYSLLRSLEIIPKYWFFYWKDDAFVDSIEFGYFKLTKPDPGTRTDGFPSIPREGSGAVTFNERSPDKQLTKHHCITHSKVLCIEVITLEHSMSVGASATEP
jgi:hypothetical protein